MWIWIRGCRRTRTASWRVSTDGRLGRWLPYWLWTSSAVRRAKIRLIRGLRDCATSAARPSTELQVTTGPKCLHQARRASETWKQKRTLSRNTTGRSTKHQRLKLCSAVVTSKSRYSPQSVSWYQLSLELFDAVNAMLYNMPIHASNANAKIRCQTYVHPRKIQDSCLCNSISTLVLVLVSHDYMDRLSRLLTSAAAFPPSPHLHLLLPSGPVLSHQPSTCP